MVDAHGDKRFGGRSARVTGDQVLAAHGIDVHKIRILARHASDAIMRYVAEAPLNTLRVIWDYRMPSVTGVESPRSSRLASKGWTISFPTIVFAQMYLIIELIIGAGATC